MNAQNLIYNGSFEEYYSCPTGNDLNDGQLEKCKGWWKPTLGTSDYFNQCNDTISFGNQGMVGVPTNFWGYQKAFQGNGYVGLLPIAWNKNTGEINGYCEYIQGKLISSLKSCYEYKFTMYVSLAEYSTYAMKSIGVVFSSDSLGQDFDVLIDTVPQVFNNNIFLNDSIDWVKIEGNFVANGTEKFVTIGYFNPNVKNDTLFIQNSVFSPNTGYSYYFLDSVSLIEIGEVSEDLCKVPDITFPNVLTVNNDGINDVISISQWLSYQLSATIYNRWGNEVVELNENTPTWNAENCTEGVYFYVLTYKIGEKTKQQNGFIQLIR